MNERIRELVRKSYLDVYGLGKERYRWEYTVQKFAELIVLECAALVDHNCDSRQIREHFGVEE